MRRRPQRSRRKERVVPARRPLRFARFALAIAIYIWEDGRLNGGNRLRAIQLSRDV
jgi:hypothetical protein